MTGYSSPAKLPLNSKAEPHQHIASEDQTKSSGTLPSDVDLGADEVVANLDDLYSGIHVPQILSDVTELEPFRISHPEALRSLENGLYQETEASGPPQSGMFGDRPFGDILLRPSK